MPLLSERDFETKEGQRRIVSAIHNLETKVHELNHLVHECLKREGRLESDLVGYEEGTGKPF